MESGVYIISVAARLLEVHPQTLRKYEKYGLVRPSRSVGMLRLYSEEDLIRLKIIKTLVDDYGVNLAGIAIIMDLIEGIDEISMISNTTDETNFNSRKAIINEKVKLLLENFVVWWAKKRIKKEDLDLKALEKEVGDLKNIAARAQADLVNYRNRMKIEILEIEKKTIKNFALKILTVIDDIDLAIDNSKEASKELLEEGLKNIRNKFENLLKQKNINVIEENKNFDPYIHEAVLKTESDSQDGSILNILRNGYVMNDEVIRPAQVEIAENLKNKNNDKEK